ncbi:MAG TPA: tetratricopeptide repeat protein, partial [Candidatus Tectomicrobia bacterium]
MTSAYVNKAHLLAQMGRHQEAMGFYHQALQIDPDDRFALVLLRQAERQEHFSQDRQQQVYLAQRVAALLRAHAEGRPPESGEDAWTSAPLTLAFLGVQRFGPPAPQAGVEEFLWHSTAQTLQA